MKPTTKQTAEKLRFFSIDDLMLIAVKDFDQDIHALALLCDLYASAHRELVQTLLDLRDRAA